MYRRCVTWRLILYCAPLAFLWWRVIAHLSVEWSVNAQYSYGWAVPFLCLYLLWQRISNSQPFRGLSPSSHLQSSIFYLLLLLLALAYAPTRLIEVANPDWRVISWALALQAVALTLLFVHFVIPNSKSEFAQPTSHFAFPVCFFLVAVPWLRPIEGPMIEHLTTANASVAVELLNWIGVPAMRLGNIIEVGSGVVGIDEACSGIRSFQATLMISLFLGDLYRLSVSRRVGLCLSGFALAFAFNVVRTTLLTWVAARDGVEAIAKWHDPAGVTILLGCFVGLWLVGTWLRPRRSLPASGSPGSPQPPSQDESPLRLDRGETPCASDIPSPIGQEPVGDGWVRKTDGCGGGGSGAGEESASAKASSAVPSASRLSSGPSPGFLAFSAALLLWLLFVEWGVARWYGGGEVSPAFTKTWVVQWPTNNPSFKTLPLGEKTERMLRYSEGANGIWQATDGTRWQAVFLRWDAGRAWLNIVSDHNPSICLPAAGQKVISVEPVNVQPIDGLELQFKRYQMERGDTPAFAYYSIWQDGVSEQRYAMERVTARDRLREVTARRGSTAMRSIELVVWGLPDAAQADLALEQQLKQLIKVVPTNRSPQKGAG